MAGQILLASAVIIGCILTVQAEPAVTSYSLTGDNNNAYDYSNGLSSSGYFSSKDPQRSTGDFYTGASSGHSLLSTGSQVNVGESTTTSSSYGGFTPSSQNTAFGGYSTATRDNLKSAYTSNVASPYRGFAGNGDTTFEGYAAGLNSQPSEMISQYTTGGKNPYGYTETAGSSYSEPVSDGSFRGYTGSTRGQSFAGFLDNEQKIGGGDSAAFTFNAVAAGEQLFGKPKDLAVGGTAGQRYASDAYPASTETRYVRGGGYASSMPLGHGHGSSSSSSVYLNSDAAAGYPGIRGAPIIYGSGKAGKYTNNRYSNEYAVGQGAAGYPSRDHEADYFLGDYSNNGNKSGNKIIIVKEGRPAGQPFHGLSSYLGKIMAGPGYKTKLAGSMSFPGSGGAHTMSSLHGSFGGNYGDGHLPRGYRHSGYSPGRGTIYPGYA